MYANSREATRINGLSFGRWVRFPKSFTGTIPSKNTGAVTGVLPYRQICLLSFCFVCSLLNQDRGRGRGKLWSLFTVKFWKFWKKNVCRLYLEVPKDIFVEYLLKIEIIKRCLNLTWKLFCLPIYVGNCA